MAQFLSGFFGNSGGGFNIGQAGQAVGMGISLGSALGNIFGGGKAAKKAQKQLIAAGRRDAAQVLMNSEVAAQTATENAYLANFDAANVELMAKDEAQRIRRAQRAHRGSQMAAAAASGADIGPVELDVMREDHLDYEKAATRTIYAGEIQARSLEQQSEDYLLQAEMARRTGKNQAESIMAEAALGAWRIKKQRQQSVINSFGSILGAVGRGYSFFKGMSEISEQGLPTEAPLQIGERTSTQDYGSPRGSEFGYPGSDRYGSPRGSETPYQPYEFNSVYDTRNF